MSTNMTENATFVCDICGEEHGIGARTTVRDGRDVCEHCLETDFAYCEHCNEYVDAYDIVSIDNGREYWCQSCAEEDAYLCEDCEDWFTRGRMFTIYGSYRADRNICDHCYTYRDWHQCEDCGAVVRECDDAYWDEDAEEWLCRSCYERHSTNAIHNYSYKPEPEFAYRGNEDYAKTLMFGVELEVDSVNDIPCDDRRETAKAVTEAAGGRVYCKSDGSLDSGFEIVSHPASLAHHMYQMRWANLMRICNKAGYRSHETETCGLHIHVGRTQLGNDNLSRELAVCNLVILSKTLQSELTKFSRRKSEHLSHWAAFTHYDFAAMHDDVERTERAYNTRNNGRYQSVNLQNTHTVEFRIFRGTLKRDTFIAAIQLVSNLCQYAMAHTPSECLTATFADIVAVHPYDELVSYSRNKRLITTETVVANA